MTYDMFIKIDGIPGQSKDAIHAGEIDVLGWQWKLSYFSSLHAEFAGRLAKATGSELKFTHSIDRASPVLAKYCFMGQHIPVAVLTTRQAAGLPHEFLKFTLYDVVITEVEPIGGSNTCYEAVTLSFTRMKHEFIGQKNNGEKLATVTAVLDIHEKRYT